jgi:hypothetical protein
MESIGGVVLSILEIDDESLTGTMDHGQRTWT